jgi:uncharacterized YigZ family protein
MSTFKLSEAVEASIDPIKGSKFLAWALPCTKDELRDRLAEARARWADVSHHCWAWVGQSESEQKFSDDGEPSGSAGRPILNVLVGQALRDTLIVVIRWYGGTKLGTGGLVRAYGGAANQALAVAEITEIVPMHSFAFLCPYDRWPALEHRLQALGVVSPDLQFDTRVTGRFDAPLSQKREIEEAVEAHYPAAMLEPEKLDDV